MTNESTPPLAEFRARYDADDNEWWRTESGHHQNLFDAACAELDAAHAVTAAVRELHRKEPHGSWCVTCTRNWPCPTSVLVG